MELYATLKFAEAYLYIKSGFSFTDVNLLVRFS